MSRNNIVKKQGTKRKDDQSSSTSYTSTGTSATTKEFPGYYYDPVKKKYFKISSDYPVSLIRNDEKMTSQTNIKIEPRKRTTTLSYIQSRKMPSVLSPEIFRRKGLEQWATQLVERNEISVPITHSIETTHDCSKMLVVEQSIYRCHFECTSWVCLYKISCDRKMFSSFKLCRKYSFESKVMNVQFHPHIRDTFLVSLLGSDWTSGHVSIISNNGSIHNEYLHDSVWYSCWSPNPQYSHLVAIAKSASIVLVDCASQFQSRTISYPSDAFCTEFSHKTPIFYFGCRNGSLCCVDIRVKKIVRSFIETYEKSSVSSIKMMNDENYFMASTVDGMIKMWDVRLLKPIKNYYGNINETKLIPFVMDSSETLMISAGQDGNTRIWSIDDGHILKIIPCPSRAGGIPAVCLGEQWGNYGGMMALALGIENTITMYY